MRAHQRPLSAGALAVLICTAVMGLAFAPALASSPDEGTDPPTESPSATETAVPTESPSAGESPTPTETPTETPTASESPAPSESPTPTESTTPTESPTPVVPEPGWEIQELTLDDGRTYFARIPTCAPAEAPECVAFVGRPRQLLVYLHGFQNREDAEFATSQLAYFAKLRGRNDTIFVYGVSKDGSKAWNADVCCTFDATDDVDYLVRTVADVSTRATVNRNRVGLFGYSNGGMMTLKATCARPDVFRAGVSWAGSWPGSCTTPGVKIAQLHGALDRVVPVNGGTSYVAGRTVTLPSAASMSSRMASGTTFQLTVYAGYAHFPTWVITYNQIRWLSSTFVG